MTPAHFLHISKTGGNAVKHALRPHLDAGTYAIQLHSHATTLADIADGEKVFFVLRDPQSRFVSGFYSRQRQGRPLRNIPWTPGEEAAFARFQTANALALALSSGDETERNAAQQAMREIAHARRTLDLWFGNEPYLLSRRADILFIGFQEQLTGDFEILKGLLGIPQASLPDNDIAAHRNPAGIDEALDPLARENLRSWYAADYRLLALCRALRSESRG